MSGKMWTWSGCLNIQLSLQWLGWLWKKNKQFFWAKTDIRPQKLITNLPECLRDKFAIFSMRILLTIVMSRHTGTFYTRAFFLEYLCKILGRRSRKLRETANFPWHRFTSPSAQHQICAIPHENIVSMQSNNQNIDLYQHQNQI